MRALVQARLTEENETCQKAQLIALLTLKQWHDVDPRQLSPLIEFGMRDCPDDQWRHFQRLKQD